MPRGACGLHGLPEPMTTSVGNPPAPIRTGRPARTRSASVLPGSAASIIAPTHAQPTAEAWRISSSSASLLTRWSGSTIASAGRSSSGVPSCASMWRRWRSSIAPSPAIPTALPTRPASRSASATPLGERLVGAGVVDRDVAGADALVEHEDRVALDGQHERRVALVAEAARGGEARLVVGEPAHGPADVARAPGEQAVEAGVGDRAARALLALGELGAADLRRRRGQGGGGHQGVHLRGHGRSSSRRGLWTSIASRTSSGTPRERRVGTIRRSRWS